MKAYVRGSGFRHTLPSVFRVSGLWFVVFVATPPILTITMMVTGLVPPALHGDVWFFLYTRMPLVVLAGIVLSVLTTTRVAGPIILLRRVFEDVKEGNMDRRLSFRRCDSHWGELETAFDDMMVALNERVDSEEAA